MEAEGVPGHNNFTGGKGGPGELAEIVFEYFPLEILSAGIFCRGFCLFCFQPATSFVSIL